VKGSLVELCLDGAIEGTCTRMKAGCMRVVWDTRMKQLIWFLRKVAGLGFHMGLEHVVLRGDVDLLGTVHTGEGTAESGRIDRNGMETGRCLGVVMGASALERDEGTVHAGRRPARTVAGVAGAPSLGGGAVPGAV
jgi:hypothetical protein